MKALSIRFYVIAGAFALLVVAALVLGPDEAIRLLKAAVEVVP